MPAPNRYPVSSFGPELFALLTTGAREQKVIPGTYAELQNLRSRCSFLRSSMKREQHPMRELTSRCSFTIVFGARAVELARTHKLENPDRFYLREDQIKTTSNYRKRPKDRNSPALLVVQPFDLKFKPLLNSAGITVDAAPPPVMPDPELSPTAPPKQPARRSDSADFIDTIFDE